ncbi:phosphatidylserine decarboxylase [Kolteria novifilia]|uniref:phosphatidylserine decarboxylase n=1 Tax=Kolteria novifilia TaxID=2527975 RepID=UPI003AF38899
MNQDAHQLRSPQPLPENIRSIQPGGGWGQALELAWGRWRRAFLKTCFPGYVKRMRSLLKGDASTCPVEVIDSRDLKFFRNVADCWFEPEDDPYRWRERIPLARWGLAEVVVFGMPTVLLTILFLSGVLVSPWWALVPGAAAAFVFYFFRDPERPIPGDAATLVSPADGKVVQIEEIDDDPFLGQPGVKIGIFLSVFNCHVNRASLAGQVMRLDYRRGQFANALFEHSAEVNERLQIEMVETTAPFRPIVIRQIVGAIARRIVCDLRPGQEVERGARIGMIKFGSRTELIVPREDLVLSVKVGDRIKGGATEIGHYAP